MRLKIFSDSARRTKSIAKSLGSTMKGGEIIGLVGELGAGKTCFIQGLAEGLGVSRREYVCSPTFTIINEYKGRLSLYHFDLYRLKSAREIEGLGYEEYFGRGVTAIEWVEKLGGLMPKELLTVTIRMAGESSRELYFSCKGVYYKRLLKKFSKKIKRRKVESK